jgi:hypothetical protein
MWTLAPAQQQAATAAAAAAGLAVQSLTAAPRTVHRRAAAVLMRALVLDPEQQAVGFRYWGSVCYQLPSCLLSPAAAVARTRFWHPAHRLQLQDGCERCSEPDGCVCCLCGTEGCQLWCAAGQNAHNGRMVHIRLPACLQAVGRLWCICIQWQQTAQ